MKNIKKIICLILIFSLAFSGTQNVTAAKKHYSTKSVDWGLGLNKNHTTPGGTVPYSGFSLKKYNAIYTGNTKKKCIYLTFDCGYENGYTKKNTQYFKREKHQSNLLCHKTIYRGQCKTC